MTDTQKMLEDAARAAGFELQFTEWVDTDDQEHSMPTVPSRTGFGRESWNPLTDDGDALRLAVKLGFVIDARYTDPMAMKFNRINFWHKGKESAPFERMGFDVNVDPMAATRLAIVRAAAAIGNKLEKSE